MLIFAPQIYDKTSMQTSIILADNQDITRVGIQTLLHKVGADKLPVQRVTDLEDLETVLLATEAPIVIIDMETMEINKPEELLKIYEKQPMSRWILFQNEIDDQMLAVFGGMPSVSMILKGNSEEEIRACLKSVLGLERFLCHQLSNRILNRKRAVDNNTLTASEIEILRFISLGKSVKEIAALRFCSTHTIVTHKKNIFHKIGVNSVYEATRYALRIGLIDTDYYI